MSLKKTEHKKDKDNTHKRLIRLWAFPFLVAVLYGTVAIGRPQQMIAALKGSGRILLQVAPALAVALVVMSLLNLWVRPDHIKRFMGKGKKTRGTLLSSVAGILSTGPIYAWYPLLRGFREKGVSDFHLATFLGCRAVKIPLIPLMATYFGWDFTLILTALIILGAMFTGLVVSSSNSIWLQGMER